MKLFSLTVDFAFKALFAPNPDLLTSLINSFPSFQGENRVIRLKVLNPEIPKEISSEKFSILDIKAENERGEQFLIEMQATTRRSFPKRILYYWAKVYSRGLVKNQRYESLKKVYSINFLKESLWNERAEFLSTFHIMEKDRKFPLTEDLEIHIVELDKFVKNLQSLATDFEVWMYLLKEASNLGRESMKTLERKSPAVKKAISELRNLSRTPRNRELYEARRKAELDRASFLSDAYQEGLEKGIKEGIEKGRVQGIEKGIEEGMYLGIQINLESRFNPVPDSLLKQIRKIKDLCRLKKLLQFASTAKTLKEFKEKLKS